MQRGARGWRAWVWRGVGLAVGLVLTVAGGARGEDGAPEPGQKPESPPAAPANASSPPAAAPAVFVCPDCGNPVRAADSRCPRCGTAFEPVLPRVRKGEGGTEAGANAALGPELGPGERTEGADESPFPEAQSDVAAPPRQLLDQPWPQIGPPRASRFGFGSYGRVGATVEQGLRGARSLDIVDFRPRLQKGSYQELHFFYRDRVAELPVLLKTTLAFDETLFAYDGQTDARLFIRELYAEITPTDRLALWMGARMYRGHDIYMLDMWPLDDQNTLGFGGAFEVARDHRIQLHLGLNRLRDENSTFYFQRIELPLEDAVGVREAVFLDRNRLTGSATWRSRFEGGLGFKLHGEFTYIDTARRQLPDSADTERLPADRGFLIGGEIFFDGSPGNFARLFASYARGLSAYDELQVPFGFDRQRSVSDAWRARVAFGGALDLGVFGMHWGSYWQRFVDADGQDDRDDRDQFAATIRPLLFVGRWFRFGVEASWQGVRPDGIYPETGEKAFGQHTAVQLLVGAAAGRGPYARPVLYLFTGWHWLNRGARLELKRRLADEPDARSWVAGLQAEWWF